MRGSESFAGQVRDPITELVMTHRDEAASFTIEGLTNRKVGVAAIAVMGELWGI